VLALAFKPTYQVYFGNLSAAVAAGNVSAERIDAMVTNILTPLAALGMLGSPAPPGNLSSIATTAVHRAVARVIAEESITLVRNVGSPKPLLPLSPDTVRSIAVFGDTSTVVGVGSGSVEAPPNLVTPAEGIRNAAGPRVNVTYMSGENTLAASELAAAVDVAVGGLLS